MRSATPLLLALAVCDVTALRIAPSVWTKNCKAAANAGKTAFAAALCSASLLAAPMQVTAAPSLDDAIVEVSEASYPIIKGLNGDVWRPFSENVGNLILAIKPDKLGKSIDLGLDVFLSVPDEKVKAFNGVLKESFDGLSTSSCTLVPLPSATVATKFATVASEKVGAEKLKAFDAKWGESLKALPKTDTSICLPSKENLDKLSLAQAEIGRSFGAEQAKAFGAYTGPVLKQSITFGQVMPLAGQAKLLSPGASGAEKQAFQIAGKKIEAAAKMEANTRALEARKAAAANNQAAQAAAADPAAKLARLEEIEKQRAAVREADDARKAKLKEEESARIAELKAKRAALDAAKAAAAGK